MKQVYQKHIIIKKKKGASISKVYMYNSKNININTQMSIWQMLKLYQKESLIAACRIYACKWWKDWNLIQAISLKTIICSVESFLKRDYIFLERTYVKEPKKLFNVNKCLYSFYKSFFVLEIFKFKSWRSSYHLHNYMYLMMSYVI